MRLFLALSIYVAVPLASARDAAPIPPDATDEKNLSDYFDYMQNRMTSQNAKYTPEVRLISRVFWQRSPGQSMREAIESYNKNNKQPFNSSPNQEKLLAGEWSEMESEWRRAGSPTEIDPEKVPRALGMRGNFITRVISYTGADKQKRTLKMIPSGQGQNRPAKDGSYADPLPTASDETREKFSRAARGLDSHKMFHPTLTGASLGTSASNEELNESASSARVFKKCLDDICRLKEHIIERYSSARPGETDPQVTAMLADVAIGAGFCAQREGKSFHCMADNVRRYANLKKNGKPLLDPEKKQIAEEVAALIDTLQVNPSPPTPEPDRGTKPASDPSMAGPDSPRNRTAAH